ncbi:putative high affinity copper transporter protein [Botrytis fragariae]|uniref:Copper transport protein n=1 Tax=Botrytis fragariae TaxID=1964551 RepID=A0A8H6AMY7_9HELO|nr:putative high affinity copper transporter protein [Botrytis fragariae]KAF5870298.1 putative high affinity copper transporter protein [Botrytis fragariae]
MNMDMDMGMDMSMDMDMDMSSSTANTSLSHTPCKMSMLLNFHTTSTCYLHPSLQVHTSIQFLLTCLFSFLLPILLETTRRYQRTYDRYLRSKNAYRAQQKSLETADEDEEDKLLLGHNDNTKRPDRSRLLEWKWMRIPRISVKVWEQVLRAGIHGVQFAISYTVMMMWMYSNGYIIICILLGAVTGFGMFTRDMLEVSGSTRLEEGENDERGESCC